jgi:hypothetical protein
MDGLFVEALSVQLATLQTCNLSADQRSAVLEIFRGVLRPNHDLPVVIEERLQVPGSAVGRRGITGSCPDESGVQMILGELKGSP